MLLIQRIQRYDVYTLFNTKTLAIDENLTKEEADDVVIRYKSAIFGYMPGITFEIRPQI